MQLLKLIPLLPFYQTKFGAAYLSDSLEVIRNIPDQSINLIVTSPPYAAQYLFQIAAPKFQFKTCDNATNLKIHQFPNSQETFFYLLNRPRKQDVIQC